MGRSTLEANTIGGWSTVRRHYIIISVLYVGIVALGALLWWQWSSQYPRSGSSQDDIFPSLAESHALRYEHRPFAVPIHGNPFAGEPRPELDAAWHGLFEDIRIRVRREDLAFHNVTSLPLADGSGFTSELGVHHELHCLKKVRHWIFRDHYLQNETEDELVEYRAHVHHCLELLREAIMCRADTSLTSFRWMPSDPPHLTAEAVGWHRCVNWESLMVWVRERHVKVFEEGVVERHPNT